MARKTKTPTLTDYAQLGCRGLKTFPTYDGGGYNYRLTVDGKNVGDVHDSGTGGGPFLRFHPDHASLKEALDAVALAVKPGWIDDMDGMYLKMACLENLLGKLVDDTENRRRFKRMCRTKTLFTVPGDKEGTYRVLPTPFSDGVKVHVLKSHPDAAFYNETL